ncbi:ATP-binding protein [Georgenia sp. AZ-5]|uniref:HAMP domain-containing sensor histidine kinase n=1 Tax=Georgenia sp. AZ-5 TaxID=3367526 RepID=UPI0037541C17
MAAPARAPRLGGGPRPLDRVRSVKTKLGVLVAATVTAAAFLTWAGLQAQLGPTRTFPLAIVGALLVTQILARGMTSPLREMTSAVRAMARGDYSQRVRATSRDEVGQLAEAFNSMAEDLATVDATRREMVANVSHELRTPVAALRAQLENMVDGVVPADEATLGAALAQTERLGELIGYLLDLSRLEAGAVGLDLADVSVRDLLDDVVGQVAAATAAAGRDVRWRVDVTPVHLRLRADAARLAQVLANLLHNAARHTPPGSTVTVRAGTSALRQEVVIDVVDQGEGVPVEDRERIFERFQRGNREAGTATGGTGLGLAIARWAVSLHEGTLAVADSADGEGATMRVRLPVRGPRGERHA